MLENKERKTKNITIIEMVLIRDIIIRRTKKLSKIFINFPKILFKK
jgi:hypothetical protein